MTGTHTEKIFTTVSLEQRRPLPFLPVLIRDVMTRDPVTVEPTATVKEIAHLLISKDVHALPVVDVGDVVVGVVAEADLISRAGYPAVRSRGLAHLLADALEEHRHRWSERAEGLTAGELMTSDVISCRPDEQVSTVTRRMLHADVRTLPVVEDGRLVGVVSRHDLLCLYDRPDTEIRARVEELLADPLWSPAGHDVHASVLDGVVRLSGTVVVPGDRDVLVSALRQVPGVLEVVDRLTMAGGESGSAYIRGESRR